MPIVTFTFSYCMEDLALIAEQTKSPGIFISLPMHQCSGEACRARKKTQVLLVVVALSRRQRPCLSLGSPFPNTTSEQRAAAGNNTKKLARTTSEILFLPNTYLRK